MSISSDKPLLHPDTTVEGDQEWYDLWTEGREVRRLIGMGEMRNGVYHEKKGKSNELFRANRKITSILHTKKNEMHSLVYYLSILLTACSPDIEKDPDLRTPKFPCQILLKVEICSKAVTWEQCGHTMTVLTYQL